MSFHEQRQPDPDPGDLAEPPGVEPLAAAFRSTHAHSLHGFTLLLTVGDAQLAETLTADALNAATSRGRVRRHPERAAAWLRARALVAAAHQRTTDRTDHELRLATLGPMGVDAATIAALSSLSTQERAALIANDIERFDRGDVASIVRANDPALDTLLHRARRHYQAAYVRSLGDGQVPDGPVRRSLDETARHVLS